MIIIMIMITMIIKMMTTMITEGCASRCLLVPLNAVREQGVRLALEKRTSIDYGHRVGLGYTMVMAIW